jgi:hypothetical protein
MAKPKKPKSVYTKEYIQDMLETNARAVARGLVAIYRLQTAGERDTKSTTESNGVGFGAFDAEFLSGCAERAMRRSRERPNDEEQKERGWLTESELAAVRPKMKKYWAQLARIAEDNDDARIARMMEASNVSTA